MKNILIDIAKVLEDATRGRFDNVLCLRNADPLQLDSSLVFNFLDKFEGLSHVERDAGA
jgi:hypothetical protein